MQSPPTAPPSPRAQRPLVTRLIVSFGTASAVITVAAMVLIYYMNRQQALEGISHAARNLSESFAQQMAVRLHLLESVPGMISLDAEDGGLDTETEIAKYLTLVLERHPTIYSMCLAWSPERTPGHGPLGAYVCRHQGGVRVVDLARHPNYVTEPWFVQGMASDRPVWTMPDSKRIMDSHMVTCVTRFQSDGQPAGVVTASLTADQVEAQTNTLAIPHGYAFVIGSEGQLLSWPDRSAILRDTLTQKDAALAATIRSAPEGLVETLDPYDREQSWIYFKYLPQMALTYVQVYPIRRAMQDLHFHEGMLVGITILLNLVLIGVIWIIARSMTRPVQKILEAANLLSEGRLDAEIPTLDTRDAMKGIPKAFLTLMGQLQEQFARVQESTRREERAKRELQIAGGIQKSFLVEQFPPWPDRTDFDLFATCQEAYEVGGDFYDFFLLDDNRLAFAMADTSGKGIPAALYMAVCRTLLRAIAHSAASPAACLADVNHRLCEEARTGMFVTAVYGILDVATGEIRLCNAGHPPPLVRRADGTVEVLPRQRQRALGVRQTSPYQDQAVTLRAGDTLLLYTDGVTEAENPKQELYGDARLLASVSTLRVETAKALIEGVVEDVQRFVGGAAQSDDLTVLALRWVHPFVGASRTLTLRNRLEDIPQVEEALAALTAQVGVRGKAVLDVQLVLEELISNVVKYAHPEGGEHLVTVTLDVRPTKIRARIEDDGRPFDPHVAPQAGPSDEGPRVGGWGLRLVARKIDRMDVRRSEGRNIVEVVKLVPSEGDAGGRPG